jgi:aspartate racemase
MRCMGLIGGVSWGATAEYYRRINLDVKRRLGGHHSAQMLIRSLDLHPLLEQADDVAWQEGIFRDAACALCAGGAQLLAVASFTGHRYVGGLASLAPPLVDLVDTLGAAVRRAGVARLAVWATSYALADAKLLARLADATRTQLMPVPTEARERLDQIVFTELADGRLCDSSVAWLQGLLTRQIDDGAQALLLATTDLSPVRARLTADIPILDATEAHCTAIVDAALAESKASP